jgi:hypothetical protein
MTVCLNWGEKKAEEIFVNKCLLFIVQDGRREISSRLQTVILIKTILT